MSVRVGEYAQATYDFPGQTASDLPLEVGDVVKITDIVDDNWVKGQKVGTPNLTGAFPVAFVEHLTLPSVMTGQKVFVATQNFPAEQNGDLELTKGDVFIGLEPVDETWWKGKNGPLKGIFPVTFVAELELDDGPRSRSASARSYSLKSRSNSLISRSGSLTGGVGSGITKVPEMTFARALVDVTPQLDGELGFQMGDLIEITEILDADWFYGRCHNKEGLFSAVCVEFLDDGGSENTDAPQSNLSANQSVQSHEINNSHTVSQSSFVHEKVSESQRIENIEVRDRNVSSGSYTSENTRSHDAEITPYGRVIYPFVAQVPTELSVSENQIVTLIKHIDADWTEGEVDGKKGLLPTSFIEIVVDCPYAYNQDTNAASHTESEPHADSADITSQSNASPETQSSETAQISSPGTKAAEECHTESTKGSLSAGIAEVLHISEDHEIGLVVYSFVAEVSGDISVQEGDTVEVTRHVDKNWLEVQKEDGEKGLVPRNHIEVIGSWPRGRSESSAGSTTSSTTSHNAIVCKETPEPSDQLKQEDSAIEPVSLDKASLEPGRECAISDAHLMQKTSDLEMDNIAHVKPAPVSKTAEEKKILPPVKPSLPSRGKPPLLPKPALAPKPALHGKPSVITSQSFSTAKPISSSLQSHRVVRPRARASSDLSSLDSLIEGEMSKAKSRSNSLSSDPQIDNSATLSSNTSVNKDSHVQSVSEISSTHTIPSTDFSSKFAMDFDSAFNLNAVSQGAKTRRPHSTCDIRNEPVGDGSKRPPLTTSVSEETKTDSTDLDRRKSASFVEQKIYGTPKSSKDSAFVNKAFQMEVDEGKLVDLTTDKPRPPLRPPNRAPPVRRSSAAGVPAPSSAAQSSKIRAAPPRPQGPRIAPAPPKAPLVPTKVEPPPKIIPKRPAPKAPHIAATSVPVGGQRNSVTQPAAVQPPKRHPPRPTSFPNPPRRPPPRPADLMAFSPVGLSTAMEEDTNLELVTDLKIKLEENQGDIKKYEQAHTDLEKSLSQADSQEKEAETKDNLEFVESTLVGLKEEERRLKENLFSLSPHEARLEKARLLAAQHAEEEAKRKEEEKKREIEVKEKMRSQRGKVIDEIIETEKDYLFNLQLCLETFLDGQKPPAGVDLEFLLGNMEEIADVSQRLLVNLETCISGKSFDEQRVGKCFTFFAEDMKNTYAPYCRNHDDVITAMERYLDNSDISDYFNVKLEKMREQTNVFDIAGVLIKPVQRILKYPLLLNELLKNTEDSHPDKQEIFAAIKAMTDVAKAINEYKRRKDLVYKYKKFSDQTLSDKISKLNLHSIKKKSSRIRGRLSTNFGISLQMRDEMFEREEAKFRSLEKSVKVFLRSVLQYLEHSQEAMKCQEVVVEDIVEFYKGKDCMEVSKLHEVTMKVLDLSVNMRQTIENNVVVPLNSLVSLFSAPAHVIEKRFDKLLDYNHQLGKTENDKELQTAKNDYEAMNAQLLDELPKFYNLAFNLLRHCISVFVLARRDFMDQSLKESCVLLGLPSMASKTNMMETFNIRHTTAYDHMSLLSFIPRGFNPRVDTIKADRAKQRGRSAAAAAMADGSALQNIPATSPGSQSDAQRDNLRQNYPPNKLYLVTSTYNGSDLMDISLTEGTIVGVVKELDPMGNKERWFVDDGTNKGFAPSNILQVLDTSPVGSTTNLAGEDDELSILSYDSGENVVLSGNDGRAEYHSTGGGSSSQQEQRKQPTEYQYYYALYDFKSRHPNEASLMAGHPVAVLEFHDVEGNPEWWLVDSEGTRGYAPANYMAPIPYS